MNVYSLEPNEEDISKFMLDDLQLAAELGKTLLERNRELENTLKNQQNIIDDQAQEIVYLQKRNTALGEVNDSRLKIYEQLEVGIQDLERANHRLIVENTSDKKHIKSLLHNIDTLEAKNDELNKIVAETQKSLLAEKRKNERLEKEKNLAGNDFLSVKLRKTEGKDNENHQNHDEIDGFEANTTAPENCSFAFKSPLGNAHANSTGISLNLNESLDISNVCGEDGENNDDEILRVVTDLEKALQSEKDKVIELEDQLGVMSRENQTLQCRLVQTSANEEMKSVHEELSILEEVRQGTMCSRCLRSVDDRLMGLDEASSIAPTEDDDDRSIVDLPESGTNDVMQHQSVNDMLRSAATIKVQQRGTSDSFDEQGGQHPPSSPNPYKDLVDKYEALLEVQRHSIIRKSSGSGAGGLSLADEINQTCAEAKDDGNSSSCNASVNSKMASTHRGRTPTADFSEAETSSSGFSDETSTKSTQTDERPGFFLCSIGDGDDCKFSIYDDASPVDSRFRNRPEYRVLFKEIFAVLKKAAENKEEGEKLPLLDDQAIANVSVPPVTPANEELPTDFGDDSQSIISSAISEQSFAMSECITKTERKTAKKHIIEKNHEPLPSVAGSSSHIVDNGRVLTPLKREPLEFLAVGVNIKKRNRRKNRNLSQDRSESPSLPSPPRVLYGGSGKKRRDYRPFNPQSSNTGTGSSRPTHEWNGSSIVIYNRRMQSNAASPNTSLRGEVDISNLDYRPSTVSQDLHKLKKLDLSYAEVLRKADAASAAGYRNKKPYRGNNNGVGHHHQTYYHHH